MNDTQITLTGWIGGSLDVGSIMTASVALGIAVDDTFHYLIWFTRGRNRGLSQAEAVQLAYKKCGPAMTQTTLICGCGLVVFLLSGFAPAFSARRDRPQADRLVVLGEPDIRMGDARIEWSDGGIVRDSAALEAEIDERIAQYIAAHGGNTPMQGS